ncbi:MAG: C40 family peptidase [Lachnospiraceae bacterium]|nr:C40 family peptidase [Lachnospiraceae bacterium]
MKRNTRFLAITATAVFSIAVGSTYFTTDAIGSDSSKLGFESAIAGLDVSFENYYKAGNDVSDKEQVDEAIEEAVRVDEEAKAIEEEIAKQLEEAQKAEQETLKEQEDKESDKNKEDKTDEDNESDSQVKDEEKEPQKAPEPESEYKNVGISVADNYVNIRKEPNTNCEVLGKLYKGCAATIISSEGEWVKIKSGSVTGYINSNYLAIGFDAEELVDKYATKYAKVTARTLNVRSKMSTDSRILTQIPKGEVYQVLKEYDEWLEVSIDDGDVTGYIAKEYTQITVEFEEAISIEEEREQIRKEEEAKRAEAEQAEKLRKEREEAAKKAAKEAKRKEEEKKKQEAANKKPSSNKETATDKKPSSNKNESNKETNTSTNNSNADAKRQQVVNYALKFVGNRYVYGGTSLTNGTDCSGFTMQVYKAFGYSIPRTSRTQVGAGKKVKVSASTLKPGDLLFYTNSSGTINHVAMYIGNGKVVHASNPRSGIKVSKYNYRTPCAARRIIN